MFILNHSLSTVLQAQIFEDLILPDSIRFQEFDVIPQLMVSQGGVYVDKIVPQDILSRESLDDEELHRELLAGTVPTVDTIQR